MLLQFTAENFSSFRDKAVLSLVPGNEREHMILAPGPKDLRPIRAIVIYGANASGKSNLLSSITLASKMVLQPPTGSRKLPYHPFELESRTRRRPTQFEFELLVEKVHFSYGFQYLRNRIVSEWLYSHEGDRETLWFRRATKKGEARPTVDFGQALSSREDKPFLSFVAKGTPPKRLFLSSAMDQNVLSVEPLIEIFRGFGEGAMAGTKSIAKRISDDSDFKRYAERLLRESDTGVCALKTEERKPNRKLREIASELLNVVNRHSNSSVDVDFEALIASELDLVYGHKDEKGSVRWFPEKYESAGTIRLLELLSIIYEGRETNSRVSIVDEIDRSLHPLLAHRILADASRSRSANQLLCSTHETNLLASAALDPESIWFVEKDSNGASTLFSLAEFPEDQVSQIREDLEGGYLDGRFGGIPFLATSRHLAASEAK